MNWSWFGPRKGYGTGIASWQGAVVFIVCFGGAMAAEKLLTIPLHHWIAAGLLVAFLVIYCLTCDKDAIT